MRYLDEAGFSRNPPLRSAWTPPGMTHTLVPQSHHHRVNVLGCLTYQGGLTCESSLCGQDVITFLDRLADTVTQQTCLFLDNASIHHGQAFKLSGRLGA